QPAPALARGAEPAPLLELSGRSDDVEVLLRVQAGTARRSDVRVQLQRAVPIERTRVNLMRQDHLIESRLAGTQDEVVFADVPCGEYIIAVLPQDRDEVARVALQLQAEDETRP
ncbi:MAG: hypothetical protein HUU35_17080, partial [Armatimonadetes bacterium]|nr:hypothetical protein [Armatimonadota bacterium]